MVRVNSFRNLVQSSLEVDVLDTEKIGKDKKPSNIDKDQVVIGRNHSISKMADLVRCFWFAVFSTNQKFSKEGQLVNWQQDDGHPRLIDVQRLERLFQSTVEILYQKLLKRLLM